MKFPKNYRKIQRSQKNSEDILETFVSNFFNVLEQLWKTKIESFEEIAHGSHKIIIRTLKKN